MMNLVLFFLALIAMAVAAVLSRRSNRRLRDSQRADPKDVGKYLRQGDGKKAATVYFTGNSPRWEVWLGRIGIAGIVVFVGTFLLWFLYAVIEKAAGNR